MVGWCGFWNVDWCPGQQGPSYLRHWSKQHCVLTTWGGYGTSLDQVLWRVLVAGWSAGVPLYPHDRPPFLYAHFSGMLARLSLTRHFPMEDANHDPQHTGGRYTSSLAGLLMFPSQHHILKTPTNQPATNTLQSTWSREVPYPPRMVSTQDCLEMLRR